MCGPGALRKRQGGEGIHVLYLHQHFAARSGTAGGRSYEFSRILLEKGHTVTLITGEFEHSGLALGEGRGRAIVDLDGIELRVLRVAYRQWRSMSRRLAAFVRFMLAASRESTRVRRVDVVFATSTPLTIVIPGLVAAWWHRCPFVFEVRDLWPAGPVELGILRNRVLIWLARRLEGLAYRKATHIVALSPGMKQGVIAAGVAPEKVTVIPNASDVELFGVGEQVGLALRASLGELGMRPWVVYAGAFGRVNDLDWAVRLAGQVAARDPRIAFLFVGKGSEKESLKEQAGRLGLLGKSVFFLDPMRRGELPALLSAATVLSSFCQDLPVMRTNSANKFFDAFAAGRPVVINYGGWQADLLRGEGAGLVLEQGDLAGSAENLVRCLSDPDWLRRAGAASRRLGETVFHRRVLVDTLESVLLGAVGGTKPGASEKSYQASGGSL